jgi:hypothetical protein
MGPLSLIEALEMMRSEQIKMGGIPLEDIQEAARGTTLIQNYKSKEGGKLIARMISEHPEADGVLAYTGGGVIDLESQIREQTKNRPPHLVKLLPAEVARVGNVAGIYHLMNMAKRSRSVLRTTVV